MGSSLSPVIMTGGTCHQEGIVPPSVESVYFFTALSASDFVKQAAFAAFSAISLLGLKQIGFPQIP